MNLLNISANEKMNRSFILISLLFIFLSSNFVYALTYVSSCGTLSVAGETYVLTQNVSSSGTCFTITANNIVVDCNGKTVTFGTSTNSTFGFTASNFNNITIKNCKIVQTNSSTVANVAIWFAYSYNSSSINNTISIAARSSVGINFNYNGYNKVINNSITISSYDSSALRLLSTNYNQIFNNLINSSGYPVIVLSSGVNFFNTSLITGPNIVGGSYIGGNFWATPTGTGHSQTCTDSDGNGICDSNYTINSNNIDYLPLTYPPIYVNSCGTLNQAGKTYVLTQNVSSSGTCFTIAANNIILDCNGYTITYATGSNYSYGIYSVGYNNSIIKNCKIVQNTAPRNNVHGVWFAGSSNNRVQNVSIRIIANYSNGVYLTYSWPNSANNNVIFNSSINMTGVQGYGLGISGSYNNFTNISISTSGYVGNAINFDPSSDSNNNIFTNMSIRNNGSSSYAIQLKGNNNLFYNNLVNSTSTSPVSVISGSNSFNITKVNGTNLIGGNYLGGNFWANPSGTGHSQTCTDADYDGICDSQYTINSNNIDYLPLTYPPIYVNSCGTLDQAGKTYILTQNVSTTETCFPIGADNITLDCNGYTINHTGGLSYGVTASGIANVKIKNCIVIGSTSIQDNSGIYLSSSSNNILINNTVHHHSSYGIFIHSGLNNTLINNTAYSNNQVGIYLYSSFNNTLINNTAYSNYYGISIYSSSNNNISNSIFNNNSDVGISIGPTSNNNIISNSIGDSNGKGIYVITDANYNSIFNNTISNNQFGIYLIYNSNNNIISNNNISNNGNGTYIHSSSNNTFFNNLFNNSNNFYFEPSVQNFWNTTLNCSAGPNIVGGSCIGGNFWANPSGTGFSETCTDSDGNGICDTSYTLATDNIDYLPISTPPISLTSCGTLNQTGKTYILTQDISSNGTCFTITANNVTLDCAGHTITHLGEDSGIYVYAPATNVTIRNCNIIGNTSLSNNYGIYLNQVSYISISNVTLDSNYIGIYAVGSSFNSISDVIVNNSGFGVRLAYDSNYNLISEVVANNNGDAVSFTSSSFNSLYNIISYNNSYVSISLYSTSYINLSNVTAFDNYYGILLSDSSNNALSNITAYNNSQYGIYLTSSSNNTLSNNTVLNNYYGIFLTSSSNNTISSNTITNSTQQGIQLYSSSSYNNISNNTLTSNSEGIRLESTSSYNSIFDNVLTSNSLGFLSGSNSSYNYISNNILTSIFMNIYLYSNSSYNYISDNILTNSNNGIVLQSSFNNTFNNNFVTSINTDFVSTDSSGNTIINMTFNSSDWPTTASFTYNGNISIDSAQAFPSPGYHNISKYLDITNSSPALISINFSYSNDTIGQNETKLKLYRYDGSSWIEVPGSGVDTVNKIVYGNITQFSIFAPLAVMDTSPPIIELSSPENGVYTNETSMTFIFNATDDQSSTLNCSLYINNALNQTNSSVVNGSLTSFSLTNIADGDYSWFINCTDASGNSNISETRIFTIDTIPPSISISSPSSNSYLNSSTITITGSSSDTNLNYTNISIWQDSILIDSTITTDASWSVQLSVPTDGIYNLTAIAYDKVGYVNSISIQNITIDTIPPSISITSPSSNSYLNSGTITITGSSSDINLNYTNISIWQDSILIDSTITTDASWSVQLSVPSDGVYSINATAYDLAGNSNFSAATSITVDSTYPTISFISPTPANNTWITTNTFVINVSHTEINPDEITLFIDGSINQTRPYSGSFTNFTATLPDGIHNYSVRLNDSAGNANQTETQIIRIDTILPSISITSPSSNSYLNSKTITINGTSSDTNYNYTNISIWQGSTLINSTTTTDSSWSVQLSVPSDGVYSINATAYDLAGNENSSIIQNITVDTIPPAVALISPLNSSPVYIRSSVPLQVRFNYNETNPSNYTIILFNSSGYVASSISDNLTTSGNVNITAYLSTSGLNNGNYSINISVSDLAGHQTTVSEMNNVVIDDQIPGLIINSPSTGEYIIGDTISLNLTVFDDNLNYTVIRVYNDSESILNYTTTQSGTFVINFTLPDDTYSIQVVSYDLSGNNATASVTNVRLDSTTPFYPNACMELTLPGEYYLSSDLYSNVTCFVISSSDVLLDGQGKKITNIGSSNNIGVYAENRDNITIQNIIIQGFDPDVKLVNVTNAMLNNVTHNGGQLELINTLATVTNSRFENSTSSGVVINSSNVIINNSIVRNSAAELMNVVSSELTLINSELENSNNVDGIKISGENNITINNVKIITLGNAIRMNVEGTNNTGLIIYDSNITNVSSLIRLENSISLANRNISVKIFRNNIISSKIASSDAQVNGSGKIFLTEDIYGNYWGRSSYPYVNSSDFENMTGITDNYPYMERDGWKEEGRFRLNSSSYNFLSKDGRMSISMPYNPLNPHDNIILSRLENELFVIRSEPLFYAAAENSLVNGSLHYRFGTYESIYLPENEREELPIVSAQPIRFDIDVSDKFSENELNQVAVIESAPSRSAWPYLGGKVIFNSSGRKILINLNIINDSIDFMVGKKVSDLIDFDNVGPSVSMSQSDSIIIASYSDPMKEVTQIHNGEGIESWMANTDGIFNLFIPSNAIIRNASLLISPISGQPSFNVSIYLRQDAVSNSAGERYFFQEINSLSQPIALNLTSSLSSALGNCSLLHNGSYCLMYISVNGLSGGSINISNIRFNYSYSSGIKLPDVNTTGTISTLSSIPNAENDTVYISAGGTSVLILTIPFKAYVKSGQITIRGEDLNGIYPSDVNIWIGNGSTSNRGTPFMVYNGQMNDSVQVIAPFVNALRNYLASNNATPDDKGNIIIPLSINSSTDGAVKVTSITVDYDLRNAYDISSPSYVEGFADGTITKQLEFTTASPSKILYITVPKHSRVSNISLISAPSENITFNVDFLNDGVIEIANSTTVVQLNLTAYLQSCTPMRFDTKYGRMCLVPINVTANLGAYTNVYASFEVSSEFISVPWKYTGSDSELIRGSERRYDFLSIPQSAIKRSRSLSLEHSSIYSLQSGDIVVGYALDMAGNRGSSQYTYQVRATAPVTPPVTPPLAKIPLSGWMNCTNSLAYVITEPGSYVTVIFRSTGAFVAGGIADGSGKFEFTPTISGQYVIRSSKAGFEDNLITLSANICQVQTEISAKRILNCISGYCDVTVYVSTNKISDFELKLSDFVPSRIIRSVEGIIDRLGKKFFSYSFTDSTITIPPTQQISSTFSIIIQSVLTSALPSYNEKENKLTFAITNPAEDLEVDEIVIPLPEEVKGKEIASIEYVAADGTKKNITNYVVESDKIIVKERVVVKR